MEQPENGSGPPGARSARRSGFPMGRVFGFPLHLSPSWLILAVLVTVVYGWQVLDARPALPTVAGYAFGAAFVLGLLASVLMHELGHAVASRRLGTGVRGITLELLGGYTEMERDAPRPSVEAIVSLAGPVVSLVLALAGGLVAVLLPDGTLAAVFVGQLALSNAIIAVFNALPGLPLDGGRALHALVWAVYGDSNLGRRVAGRIGQGLAVCCVVAAVLLYLVGWLKALGIVFGVLVAASIWFGATAAVRLGRAGARLHLLSVDELTRPLWRVPSGTPLALAQGYAAAAGVPHAALAVVDADGSIRSVVHDAQAAAVPADRRLRVPVDDVARAIDPDRALPSGLRGTDVLRAVEGDPVAEYLVTAGKDVVGILRVADLARVLEPRRSGR